METRSYFAEYNLLQKTILHGDILASPVDKLASEYYKEIK
ncbi:7733_t:CDS:2 [Funneliformis caledonium]|uniref:7733_t:CDS:1 n=1 Tax=Funneliformis caledonium TaxID=1117310 RepID=A0A9N9ANZ4_9GLOM|nr:7733_t:CDS:2 [Funneliformis caledonium]